jgi:hypothetical protein
MNKDAKKILKIILVSVFFLFILVFILFNSKSLILGVKIKNVKFGDNLPAQSGMKVDNSILEITGIAKNAIKLSLNGREISIDQKGNFDETITLFPGYNVVNIKAQDKFGNNDEKNYQLIY